VKSTSWGVFGVMVSLEEAWQTYIFLADDLSIHDGYWMWWEPSKLPHSRLVNYGPDGTLSLATRRQQMQEERSELLNRVKAREERVTCLWRSMDRDPPEDSHN
jgi:hypothetical protein